MVDIHSHILPLIDDGSHSLEESIAMLQRSIASGVNAMVATPHLYPGCYTASTRDRDEMIAALQEEASRRELQIQILPGRECFFSLEIYQYEKDLSKLTIADGGRYLLIESPMQGIPQSVDEMILGLQANHVTPIIAHAERYLDVIEDANRLHKYIQQGCLIQINIGSLLGKYGKVIQRTAEVLLEHRMGHIVASDMHSRHSIALGEGFDVLSKLVGIDEAKCLVEDRPRAVIQNRPVKRWDPLEYRPRKHFRNLWGLLE
jgi:protein-tyrosine phosphatase